MAMLQPEKPFSITPGYDILLRGSIEMPIGLHQLYIATARQLCRPHYKMGSLKGVQAKLRTLIDHEYIQYDAIPTKFTRSPYYYAMDKLGIQYLRQVGVDVDQGFRAEKEVNKHSLFIEHTLELNDIIIAAALLKRSNPNYWLESFTHERMLKRKPYRAKWQDNQFTLIPDALLTFRMIVPDGRQRRMAVVVEHDRGTEEQYYFRRRIRAYVMMLKSESYKEMFQVGGITVAFTTSAGVERLKHMLEWTVKELSGEPKSIGGAFRFTFLDLTCPDKPIDPHRLWLEPCWYTLYDLQPTSLLSGV